MNQTKKNPRSTPTHFFQKQTGDEPYLNTRQINLSFIRAILRIRFITFRQAPPSSP